MRIGDLKKQTKFRRVDQDLKEEINQEEEEKKLLKRIKENGKAESESGEAK